MTLNQIRTALYRAMLCISASILALNVLLILYSVFTRYILNHSPIWSDELSRYAIIACVMQVMSCAYMDSRHMKVSFVEQIVSARLRNMIQMYQWLVVLGVSLFFVYVSARYSLSMGKFSSMGLGISKTIPLLAIPIGFTALFFMALTKGPYSSPEQVRGDLC
ncbi:TRAP transporter small permease [Marinomonas sp. 15G1-11]|uniref:TRAP transporter small permease protein n=1 Tax=Marinomonas phaeophyticola TaxID=3004091 RepID=A0ABT4JVM0_9GAMM|nr:TRAP transporter small permease [Marinomonas sp. 15G1-11]MCZ2722296.1 TRAP transporter small permease [Marinomonas sp. 15G1-11]